MGGAPRQDILPPIRSTAPIKKSAMFGGDDDDEEEDFKPISKPLPVIGAKAAIPDRKTAAADPGDSKTKFKNLFVDDEDEDY